MTRLQNRKLTLDLAAVDVSAPAAQAVETARSLTVEIGSEPSEQPGQTIAFEQTTEAALRVRGDPNRLEQVLLNLLTNAVKYTPPTTRIVVRVAPVEGDATIAVRDDGPGISAEALAQIFTPFYQAARSDRSSRSGMGLGLFITKQLV
ncbi:MAG: sensor histidine kinase, partial [Chloroflexota bacterium]